MICFNNHDHGRQICAAYHSVFAPEINAVISREEDGILYGGSVFENYTGEGGSIGIHVASFRPNWVNRELLWYTFDYPFNQLKCNQVFGQVPSKNEKALKFDYSLGFKLVAKIPSVFPDDDMLLLSMRQEDCRALKMKPRSFSTREERSHG